MHIRLERAQSAVAMQMIAALNADLMARYPGAPVFGIEPDGFEDAGGRFAVGYNGETPVACGALRSYEGKAEFKRIYVVPQQRGQGLGAAMLAFLEDVARHAGFSVAVLETGSGQPEAISLYRKLGWREIAPFGEYAADSYTGDGHCKTLCGRAGFRHVCFMKSL